MSVNFNGEIGDFADAKVRAVSSAVLYGKSVFTTLGIYGGKPFLWREHFARLKKHAAQIGLNFAEINESRLENALFEIIYANKINDGRARISIFDESASKIWQFESENQSEISFLIIVGNRREIERENFSLTASPFRVNTKSPLVGLKCGNYLENLLAFDEAKKRKANEAVRLNERGEIVSACLANIFWTKNGKLFTPALETGALEGTTRNFVKKIALENNIEVFEVKEKLATLKKADAILLTSAGIESVKILRFEDKTLKSDKTSEFISTTLTQVLRSEVS